MHIAPMLMMAAALAAVQVSPSTPPPQQSATASITLGYTLTIFAIPFGHLHYAATFEQAHYKAEMHFRTGGLAAVLWKSRIDTLGRGRAEPGALIPDQYTSRSLSRQGTQQSVRIDYAGKEGPLVTADPPYDLSRYPVTDAQKRGTVDPLTAISSIVGGLNSPNGEPCSRKLAIFDGRRRYDVVFTLVREENDPSHDATTHPRICEAEYRHIAGVKQDVVDVSSVPAIYAELIDVVAGTRHYTLAKAIWSSFLWGAVNAKLTDLRIDGRAVVP